MAERPEYINFKYNFKVYWSILRTYRWIFFGIMLLVLISEGVGILEQYLFKLIIDKATLVEAGTAAVSEFVHTLTIIALVFAGAAILRSVSKYAHIHSINFLEVHAIRDLKLRFFNHILSLSHSFHTTHKTGSLISRLIRGSSALERLTDVIIFNWTPLIFKLSIVVVTLLYFDVYISLAVGLTVLTFLYYSIRIQREQEPTTIIRNNVEDREKAAISDYMMNIDSIKHFGKEKRVASLFASMAEKTKSITKKQWDYYRKMDAGQSLILSGGSVLILLISLRSFLAGTLSVGTIVFTYSTYLGLLGALFGFLHGVRSYYQSMADFQVLFQYNHHTNDIKDEPHALKTPIKHGAIVFKDVSFNYGKRKVFHKLNLEIPKHTKVAFVGHSGCGKTTLIKLLYRLYDIDAGEILIDGTSITRWQQETLRSEMSIVPQECALFDDTIYNNIAFSNPQATKKEVLRAIRFAQLDKIIKQFPQKEQTIVGERGVRLSGGEKQRVSIARALLANKKILVLDEATSSLDSQTEYEIQRNLERLMKGRTSLIIAHRLSTIMHADVIVVMSRGRIVQMGTHRQLLAREGRYKKLWKLQKGGYLRD